MRKRVAAKVIERAYFAEYVALEWRGYRFSTWKRASNRLSRGGNRRRGITVAIVVATREGAVRPARAP
jgi:hypothetical protein